MRLARRGTLRRGANLTPMVDVVFLLLFFFMLASRFGPDEGLTLALGGGGGTWSGPPRLVGVGPEGVTLNGVGTDAAGLPAALGRLVTSEADPVVISPREGAGTGDLVAVIDLLQEAGFTGLVIVR